MTFHSFTEIIRLKDLAHPGKAHRLMFLAAPRKILHNLKTVKVQKKIQSGTIGYIMSTNNLNNFFTIFLTWWWCWGRSRFASFYPDLTFSWNEFCLFHLRKKNLSLPKFYKDRLQCIEKRSLEKVIDDIQKEWRRL